MTLVCKSVGIWDAIVNLIYRCGVAITPDINPIDVGLETSCPRDSKKVSCELGSQKYSMDWEIFEKMWEGCKLQEQNSKVNSKKKIQNTLHCIWR